MASSAMAERKIDYWIDLLWRRRRTAGWVAGGIFGFIFLVTILYPPIYESKAQLLIQSNRANYLISPALQTSSDSSTPLVSDRALTEQDLNSEVELLNQPELIDQAFDQVGGSTRSPGIFHAAFSIVGSVIGLPEALYRLIHNEPALNAKQKRLLVIQSKLSAVVIRKSNMIEVSLRSNDPEWTRKFLSALLDRYFELHSKIEHSARSTRFFDTQSELLRKRLEKSEEHLRDVREQTGLVSLSDQSEAIVYQLSGFQAEYRKNASRLAGVKSQVTALELGLKDTPMRFLKEVKEAANPSYLQVKTKSVSLELDRADILQRYQPNSDTAKAVTESVTNANNILKAQQPSIVSERLSDLNPVWLGLASNLAQANVTYSALSTTQESLAQQIAQYQAELKQLAQSGLLIDRATRDTDADRESYLSYLRKGEEARAQLALNESQIMNVVLAAAPYTPLVPIFPRVGLNLVLGLILGLIAGVAVAWWEERLDAIIYSAFAIFEMTRLPVLAMLRDDPVIAPLANGAQGTS
jgi:succinoglycan biosynthesis transport protein ExoP